LEDPNRREFRNLLSTLEADREQSRFRERERRIEKNRYVYRFEELTRDVILPTLRELMLDLERRGHLTRLTRKSAERLRLDVQIESQGLKRCALEIGLHPGETGKVKVDYAWGWKTGEPAVLPLEEVDAVQVSGWVLNLLRGLP
jgi:hypothetical protein